MGQICGAQLAQTANINKIIYRKANFQGGYRVQTQQTQQTQTRKNNLFLFEFVGRICNAN